MAALGPAGKAARRWCFTTQCDESVTSMALSAGEHVIYACGQFERAPSTGRKHFQSYAEYKQPQTGRKAAQRAGLPDGTHFEAARGRPDQCRDYCRKPDTAIPGTFIEVGVWRGEHERQGNTKPMAAFYEDVKAGVPLHKLLWEQPELFNRAYKITGLLAGLAPRLPRHPVRVYLFVGGTGTGKTRRATGCEHGRTWISSFTGSSTWFTGYMGHEIAVLDDLRDSTLQLPYLLRVLDRYELHVEIKGSTVPWIPQCIIATSNLPLRDWYPERSPAERDALDRRFTDVWTFTSDGHTVERGDGKFPSGITDDGVLQYA